MLVARNAIKISQATGRFAMPSRTTFSGRPRVRVSFPEKVAHGTLIALGLIATPCYIAVNLKNYRH